MAKNAAPVWGWWATRLQQYLQDADLLDPLTKSQISGAERGEAQVGFERGRVSATVGVQHTATLKVKPLTDREWRKALEAIVADADVARRLLSGMPGAELEQVLAKAGVALFPTERPPALRCNCWERWGCRHMRVLAVRGGRLLDANPFLWLEVLGRQRDELLAAVRAQLTDRSSAAQVGAGAPPPPAASAERFLTTETDPESIPVRPGSAAAPDALLKLLGPMPLPDPFRSVTHVGEVEINRGGRAFRTMGMVTETPDEVVARYLTVISQGAAELAAGDRAPMYGDEAAPGKKVPVKQRLAEEVAEVVGRSDGMWSLTQLYAACSSARVLSFPVAADALEDALELLPPEFLTLSGGHVGLRSAVLTGTAFRHVISFTEWQRGRLRADADWVIALSVAGFAPPYDIRIGGETCRVFDLEHPQAHDGLFANFGPDVGDELVITVADTAGPVLVGALHRRKQPVSLGLPMIDRTAARALSGHLAELKAWAMTEVEAVEALLAYGFYREERIPDPVWLLPAAAGQVLHWGRERTLTAHSWYESRAPLGRTVLVAWRDRQPVLNQFAKTLMDAGQTGREIEAALACLEAWCRHWPGDQRDRQHPPTVAALADFLWNVAPVQVTKLPDRVPQVLAAWFRFLAERQPGPAATFKDLHQVCALGSAYLHRLQTVPRGRPREQVEAWLLEGYRWLGPELVFSK